MVSIRRCRIYNEERPRTPPPSRQSSLRLWPGIEGGFLRATSGTRSRWDSAAEVETLEISFAQGKGVDAQVQLTTCSSGNLKRVSHLRTPTSRQNQAEPSLIVTLVASNSEEGLLYCKRLLDIDVIDYIDRTVCGTMGSTASRQREFIPKRFDYPSCELQLIRAFDS